MKMLLHTCCGPCSIYPLRILGEQNFEIVGFFYRSNIHPLTECRKRQEALTTYAQTVALPLIIEKTYDLEGFIRQMVFREADRCRFCYHARLTATALLAQESGYDLFSSTLLYSRHQQHDAIRAIGESVGRSVGVPFYYHDFRQGWQEGVVASKNLGMYRQPYCGCIYSEKERYDR